MKKASNVLIRRFIGTGLFALGLFGLVVPFVQGIALMILGLYVLSVDSFWLQTHVQQCCERFPRFGKVFHSFDGTMRKLLRAKD